MEKSARHPLRWGVNAVVERGALLLQQPQFLSHGIEKRKRHYPKGSTSCFLFGYTEILFGRGSFEGKSSADEREAYKGTPSEETAIVNGILIKLGNSKNFDLNSFRMAQRKSEAHKCTPPINYSIYGYTENLRPNLT